MTITTIPRRIHLIDRLVRSLIRQTRPPNGILISLSKIYKRFHYEMADSSRIMPHPILSITECEDDYGPGSKILCTVSRLRLLMATTPSDSHVFVVLADDDRYYQPTALELMERSITNDPTTAVSFYTYDLRDTPLRVGQGADLHAFDARNVIALGSSSTLNPHLGVRARIDDGLLFDRTAARCAFCAS